MNSVALYRPDIQMARLNIVGCFSVNNWQHTLHRDYSRLHRGKSVPPQLIFYKGAKGVENELFILMVGLHFFFYGDILSLSMLEIHCSQDSIILSFQPEIVAVMYRSSPVLSIREQIRQPLMEIPLWACQNTQSTKRVLSFPFQDYLPLCRPFITQSIFVSLN